MSAWRQRWAFRLLGQSVVVPVDRCVHYCAFRYGHGEPHPYERYALALARGEDLAAARAAFADFLRHYRPRDFGAALGVTLSRAYALWDFPWVRGGPERAAWVDDPDDAPDIITHFSERGILRFRLEQEFFWAERLHYSLRRFGFQPERADRPIEVRTLLAADGATSHLLLDGNHRLAALVARGAKEVPVRQLARQVVRETELAAWPRVADGTYAPEDARRIFRAYFAGNSTPRTTEVPAPMIPDFSPVAA